MATGRCWGDLLDCQLDRGRQGGDGAAIYPECPRRANLHGERGATAIYPAGLTGAGKVATGRCWGDLLDCQLVQGGDAGDGPAMRASGPAIYPECQRQTGTAPDRDSARPGQRQPVKVCLIYSTASLSRAAMRATGRRWRGLAARRRAW